MNQSSTAETTYLYLIRHGATEANEQIPYILQGRGIDLPLSPIGREQATAVGQFMSGLELDCIYASPLKRAVETAEAVAGHHDFEVSFIEHLSECDVGQWEGMDWDSIMRAHPDQYRNFMGNPAENAYLGGESYGDVLNRVQPAIDGLLRRHTGESIAVIAHNIVNRVYLAGLLGIELRKAKGIRQSNTGVNVIRYRDGETELITLNAVFHLEERLR